MPELLVLQDVVRLKGDIVHPKNLNHSVGEAATRLRNDFHKHVITEPCAMFLHLFGDALHEDDDVGLGDQLGDVLSDGVRLG